MSVVAVALASAPAAAESSAVRAGDRRDPGGLRRARPAPRWPGSPAWRCARWWRRTPATTWRVAFGGFAPGFAYLVGEDRRLHVPRRDSAADRRARGCGRPGRRVHRGLPAGVAGRLAADRHDRRSRCGTSTATRRRCSRRAAVVRFVDGRMTLALRVRAPAPLCLVQDLGRPGASGVGSAGPGPPTARRAAPGEPAVANAEDARRPRGAARRSGPSRSRAVRRPSRSPAPPPGQRRRTCGRVRHGGGGAAPGRCCGSVRRPAGSGRTSRSAGASTCTRCSARAATT